MTSQSDNRVAIVTGARPWGVGGATARALARRGYDIALVDLRQDWGEQSAEAIAVGSASGGRGGGRRHSLRRLSPEPRDVGGNHSRQRGAGDAALRAARRLSRSKRRKADDGQRRQDPPGGHRA